MAEEIQNSEVTESVEQEYVEAHEATDTELDSFLQEQPFDRPPVIEEKKEEAKEDVSEEPKSAEDVEALKKSNADLQAKLEKQRRLLEQSELFNKRRSTELGNERKKVRELQAQLAQYLTDENFQLHPSQANRALIEHDKLEQRALKLEEEEKKLQKISEGQAILAKNIDIENIPMNDIAEVLIAHDKLPENFVKGFLPGMLEFNGVEPETVLQLVKRAELWSETKKALGYASERIKALEEEVAKLKEKPNAVLKDVSNALRRGPQVTAATGGGAQTRSDRIVRDPALMNDAELEEFLAASK